MQFIFVLVFPLHATKLERAVLRIESENWSLDCGPQGTGDYHGFSLPEISSFSVRKTSQDSWSISSVLQKPADNLGTSREMAAMPSPLIGKVPSPSESLGSGHHPCETTFNSLFPVSCPTLAGWRLTRCFSWPPRGRKHVPCWQCVWGHCWLPLSWKEGKGSHSAHAVSGCWL